MRANELELLRASGVEPCLLMDNGGKTGRLPFIEAALALRPGVDMLINSDFRNPVNQRGLTEYVTSPSAIYSIDKWKRYNSDGLASMILTPEGIQFKASAGATSGFVQILEASSLTAGQIYTLSAFLKVTKSDTIITSPVNENIALSYGNSTDSITESAYLAKAKAVLNEWIVHSMTFVLQESVDGVYNFRIRSVAGDVEYCAAAMKLEPGDKQTIVHQDTSGSLVLSDPSPNEALELLKCQRYQAVIFRENDISAISISDFAICISSTAATALIHLPTTLRTMPIVKFKKIFLMDHDGNITYEITSMFVARFSKNVLKLNITCNGGSLTVGAHYFLAKIDDGFLVFDANL